MFCPCALVQFIMPPRNIVVGPAILIEYRTCQVAKGWGWYILFLNLWSNVSYEVIGPTVGILLEHGHGV